MTLAVDAGHPLDSFSISPDIRDYINVLTAVEIEQRLAQEAERQGKTPLDNWFSPEWNIIFLVLLAGFLMAQEKDNPQKPNSDALNDFLRKYVSEMPEGSAQDRPSAKPRPQRTRRPYNPQGLVAALAAFEQGDAEEQSRTLRYLETAVDRDRPGQRRIFGPGLNPMATDEAA